MTLTLFVFQFGTEWKHVIVEIFDWLSRKNFKKGGFDLVGPPNSGKSYVFGSLHDVFMLIGYVRPNAGYTFNFDSCLDKQIVVCEEFLIEKSDHHTIETIKDILSGNPDTIKVKLRESQILKPVPRLFISNHKNFDFNADNNPWKTRLYHRDVVEYDGWDDMTAQYRLNPYAWIQLAKCHYCIAFCFKKIRKMVYEVKFFYLFVKYHFS